MKDSVVGKLLCLAAPALAGLAHISFFYGWGPIPFWVVGAIAVGAGVGGIIVSRTPSRKDADLPVSAVYIILAVLGLLVGAFYFSVIGPVLVFFEMLSRVVGDGFAVTWLIA